MAQRNRFRPNSGSNRRPPGNQSSKGNYSKGKKSDYSKPGEEKRSSSQSPRPFDKKKFFRKSDDQHGSSSYRRDSGDKPSRDDKNVSGGSEPRSWKPPFSGSKPRFEKPGERKEGGGYGKPRYSGSKSRFEKPGERREGGKDYSKPRFSGSKSRFDKPGGDRKEGDRDYSKPRFSGSKSRFDKPGGDRKEGDRDYSKPRFSGSKSRFGKPGGDRKEGDRDYSKPRFAGSKPRYGKPGDRPEGASNFRKPRIAGKSYGRKQRGPEATPVDKPKDGPIRLNKYISNSGVCSRREADELITAGLITVNGKSVTELGFKVQLTDDVRYEGKRLKAEMPVYILLNKPKGYITTTDDPQERNTVMQLIHGACKQRVYPVGRLDRNTSGLLLLTNDGDLTDKLTHPSYNVKKIYKAELDRPLTKNDFQKILDGVRLEEGKAPVDDLAIVSEDSLTVGIEIHIGWNRIVRRIFESLGYEVVRLDRTVYATLDKKELPRGHWRFLREEEIVRLKHFQ